MPGTQAEGGGTRNQRLSGEDEEKDSKVVPQKFRESMDSLPWSSSHADLIVQGLPLLQPREWPRRGAQAGPAGVVGLYLSLSSPQAQAPDALFYR